MRMTPGRVEKPFILSALAVGFGIIAGAMISAAAYIGWVSYTTMKINRTLDDGGCILGFVVFPMAVSFVSKRYYFWWGVVPGVVAYIAARAMTHSYSIGVMIAKHIGGDSVLDFMGPMGLPKGFLAIAIAGTLASAGLVSLIRQTVVNQEN